MFGKSEDKWIEIAFGEQKLPEGFTAKDADDLEILRTYESLRDDLELLKDIPEMQFSNERLRDAILAAGPKASVEAPWVLRWGWAIAPVAAVLAIGVVFLKSNFSNVEPNVIVAPAGLQSSTAIASNNSLPLSSNADTNASNVATIVAPTVGRSEVVAAKPRAKSSVRRKLGVRPSGVKLAMATRVAREKKVEESVATSLKSSAVTMAADVAPGMALRQDGNQSGEGSGSLETAVAPMKSDVSNSVILIDASSDSVTGLPNAVEVSKNSEKVSLGG